MGVLLATWGDYAHAQRYADQSLTIFRQVGDRWGEADALHRLGSLLQIEGEYGQAMAFYQQALALAQAIGYQRCTALALRSLGHLALQQDQPAVAKAHDTAAPSLARAGNFTGYALEALAGLTVVALVQGDSALAQRLVDEVLAALDAEAFSQANEPFRIWYDCYHVLHTIQSALAVSTITQAHMQLQQQADRITDAAIRHAFLHDVPIHRALVEAFVEQG